MTIEAEEDIKIIEVVIEFPQDQGLEAQTLVEVESTGEEVVQVVDRAEELTAQPSR